MDRICLIGDSITHGTGDEYLLGWPGIIFQKKLQTTIYNIGVRADTSELISLRWFNESKSRLPEGQQCGLIFALGTNDAALEMGKGIRVSLQNSVANVKNILTQAQDWLPTLMIGPIPVIDTMQPFDSGVALYAFNNQRIATYNDAYKSLTLELKIPYLDVFNYLKDNPAWLDSQKSNDGVHPKHKGYKELANYINSWNAFHEFMNAQKNRPMSHRGSMNH